MNFPLRAIGTLLAGAAFCALGTSIAAASPAVPGAGVSSVDAVQSLLGDSNYFGIILRNGTNSALTIYTELGSDWDIAAGSAPVNTVIKQGAQIKLFLYNNGAGTDAVGIKPTDSDGNLGIGFFQNALGGISIDPLPPNSLKISVDGDGDGEDVVAITDQ